MLCVANVALSDWPVDHARDVDPSSERIRGLLRAGFIVPLELAGSAQRYDGEDGGAAESGERIDALVRKDLAKKSKRAARE